MSVAWSWVVIIGTLGSILGYFLLLQMNRTVTRQPGETTGHVYDGIEEYDNPLPVWWYWMFLVTILYGLVYLAWYPGLGNFEGYASWTSEGEVTADLQADQAKYEAIYATYRDIPVEELAADPAAFKMGQRLFLNNCAACHGSAAAGGPGFPDLTDDAWIWGGAGAQIEQTILNGRQAVMPAWKGLIPDAGIADTALYVLSLAGGEVDEGAAARGQPTFALYCAACHGAGGKGNPLLGAADLTDRFWLYGNTLEIVKTTIMKGRSGEMPGFKAKLGESRVHIIAGYIYGLTN